MNISTRLYLPLCNAGHTCRAVDECIVADVSRLQDRRAAAARAVRCDRQAVCATFILGHYLIFLQKNVALIFLLLILFLTIPFSLVGYQRWAA